MRKRIQVVIEQDDEKFDFWVQQEKWIDDCIQDHGGFHLKDRIWIREEKKAIVELEFPTEHQLYQAAVDTVGGLAKMGIYEKFVKLECLYHPRQEKAKSALNWLESQDCAVS